MSRVIRARLTPRCHVVEAFVGESENAICPLCEGAGPVGTTCSERPCQKRGYHYIPAEYLAAAERATSDPDVGRRVGDYLLVRLLGAGGFGKVFVALQLPLLMPCAMKLVRFDEGDALADVKLAKFQSEAQALARLSHPNVVRLLHYGVTGQMPFMVMELVPGARTLKSEIALRAARGEEYGASEIASILSQLVDALEAAHDLGVIHRDVKPENIMLQSVRGHPNLVKLLDFGLAKDLAEGDETSLALGTPAYMAPEQLARNNLGPWTDLYAVGVIAFELMTGRRLFATRVPREVLAQKLDPAFDPLAHVEDLAIPPATRAFLAKALARWPADRFATASALREAMHLAFRELEVGRRSVDVSALATPSEIVREVRAAVRSDASPEPEATVLPSMVAPRRARPRTLVTLGSVALVATAAAVTATFIGADRGGPDPVRVAGVGAIDASIRAEHTVSGAGTATGAASTVSLSDAAAEVVPDTRDAGRPPTLLDRLIMENPFVPVRPATGRVRLGLDPGDSRLVPHLATNAFDPRRDVVAPTTPFEMQAHEVTWGELDAAAEENPELRFEPRPAWVPDAPAGRRPLPVSGIPWQVAAAYCHTLGARLPSEAEWEWAARGEALRIWPWGDDARPWKTAAEREQWAHVVATRPVPLVPVREDAGALVDLLGNAQEWTADLWREPRPGLDEAWVAEGDQTYRAVRGLPLVGRASEPLAGDGLAHREPLCATGGCVARSTALRETVGFRCARNGHAQ